MVAQPYGPTQGQHVALEVVAAEKVPGTTEVCWHGWVSVGSQSRKVTGVLLYIVNEVGVEPGWGPRGPQEGTGKLGWEPWEHPVG